LHAASYYFHDVLMLFRDAAAATAAYACAALINVIFMLSYADIPYAIQRCHLRRAAVDAIEARALRARVPATAADATLPLLLFWRMLLPPGAMPPRHLPPRDTEPPLMPPCR